jgi:dihydroneopterin aldolase
MTFYGYHGVNPEERTLGQRFVVDLALSLDLRPAGESDDLAKTANYATIHGIVRRVVEGPPRSLLEALAERIAGAVLAEVGGTAVRVRVSKPWAPIKGGVIGNVAVEVERGAQAGGRASPQA